MNTNDSTESCIAGLADEKTSWSFTKPLRQRTSKCSLFV